jgi:hypothetical protein
VAVDGNYVYVAASDAGLRVVSVADPAHPAQVGYYDMPGQAWDVSVNGSLAYVTNDSLGLVICEFLGEGVQETINDEGATMNVPPTIVRGVLHLPASSVGRAASSVLLDAAGRKVMELRVGANDVSRLVPGVYFCRQTAGFASCAPASSVMRQASSVTKVMIVR